MKHRRNRVFIIGLFAFIIVLAGAYALFATTLNITGTAGGAADFKVEFSDYSVSVPEKATATLDTAKTSMNISANLSFPGDTVTIYFTIKNTGNLSSTVSDLTIAENSTTDFNISIVGLTDIEGTALAPEETTSGSIVVTWNSASTNQTPESVDFSVNVDYIQTT